MVVWLNGAFGVGKTSTANAIAERSAGSLRIFDPEWVGFMLRANLDGLQFDDFQDLPSWRSLVPRVACEIASLTNDDLLAVQTVLVECYWTEIRLGFERLGTDLLHVVLDCDEDVLRARIADDVVEPGAAQWRLDHVERFSSARSWMIAEADMVVDVSDRPASSAAQLILDGVARC